MHQRVPTPASGEEAFDAALPRPRVTHGHDDVVGDGRGFDAHDHLLVAAASVIDRIRARLTDCEKQRIACVGADPLAFEPSGETVPNTS
jgi:hypothetical protein